jgi:hypothetical protein
LKWHAPFDFNSSPHFATSNTLFIISCYRSLSYISSFNFVISSSCSQIPQLDHQSGCIFCLQTPHLLELCRIAPRQNGWNFGLQLCFKPHLNLRFSLKDMGLQNCGIPNFRNWEPSNGMWHTTYMQVNQGDSWLLVVKSW